ncbi:MAG: hypothetical protein KDD32_07535 [Bacteroidetes bacterium]|nr:hypothetical protein [Bacteroidota bacterium]
MKTITFTILFAIVATVLVNAQSIEISPTQKMVSKYDDYEVVGTNSIGTIVHYYSKGNNKLQVFNSKLRPFNEVDLNFDEKGSKIEKILLTKDLILVFYSVLERDYEYLKVKRINYRLDALKEGTLLDSIKRSAINSYEGYFVKPSLNDQYYVAFTYDQKPNRMEVHYTLMDKQLKVLKSADIYTDDKTNLTLESVKVNNHGDLLVVVGHLNRRSSDDEDFSFKSFTVNYISGDNYETSISSITDENYLYKDLVTNWDEENRTAILVGTYQKIKEREDIGVFYTAIKSAGQTIDYNKIAFKEEDFAGTNSPYRKWMDNAEIQIPKRIIPRSDGGFIYILEAEYHNFQVITTAPNSNTYSYYPEYGNYYDENFYYDLMVVSVNPDGTIDWRSNMPKSQETENDLGRYSSFLYHGANNVSKLLFVDDIYGNGNLTEFNFNPNGVWNKQVILNSYRDDLLLVAKKGIQVSGNEVVIPSEKKNRLRLVKITY